MFALLTPDQRQEALVATADLVVAGEAAGPFPAGRLLLWLSTNDGPPAEAKPLLNLVGRLGTDPAGQRAAMAGVLGGQPMLARPTEPRLFMVVCRSTGASVDAEDIAGHRRNTARNFDRMLAGLVLGHAEGRPGVDKAIYLYEAMDSADARAMIESDPLTRKGMWTDISVQAARVVQDRLSPVPPVQPTADDR